MIKRSPTLFWALGAAVTFAAALSAQSAVSPAQPQGTGGRTVWNGVYSEAQAARGHDFYNTYCSVCHREDLSGGSDAGGGNGRPLIGDRFWEDWGDDSLNLIFGMMSSTMPNNAPGSLEQNKYLDILSYVLQKNGFPAGAQELNAADVPGIRVVAEDGKAQPVSSFSLVTAVGCLNSVAGGWSLDKASDPVKTRDPYPSKVEVLDPATAAALGVQTFGLNDVFPDPAPHAGHKMEARGFLVKGQDGQRAINVTSFRMISAACDK